jgi:predicted thioredoxin/glutaredoxin
MSKKYRTQEQLDYMTDDEIHHLVCLVANQVTDTLDPKRTIDGMVNQIMHDNGLCEGLMLRRDFDGVTEARWMVKKMIGELLATGQARV